jgi:hypothetical protein
MSSNFLRVTVSFRPSPLTTKFFPGNRQGRWVSTNTRQDKETSTDIPAWSRLRSCDPNVPADIQVSLSLSLYRIMTAVRILCRECFVLGGLMELLTPLRVEHVVLFPLSICTILSSFKTRRFGDCILSPFSRSIYSSGDTEKLYTVSSLQNVVF